VILDAEKQAWMGAGTDGAFGWPGAFGTWWRADPAEDMVMLYLVQNSMPLEPGSASQLATGQRMAAAAALPMFQNITYAALGR
jgi:CubicO group peptidase (beta-lactamase class C family)